MGFHNDRPVGCAAVYDNDKGGTRRSLISVGAVINVGPQLWRAVIIDGLFEAYGKAP